MKFFLLLLLIFEASLGPIFVKYVLNASDMSFGLVSRWPSIVFVNIYSQMINEIVPSSFPTPFHHPRYHGQGAE